jgi:hypothetical protein
MPHPHGLREYFNRLNFLRQVPENMSQFMI